MKNIFKYIGVMGIVGFVSLSNINASTVSVEPKPGHDTKFGYKTQTQTLHTENCTYNIYCLDKGLPNQRSFDGCSISDVTTTAFGQVTGDHDSKEYQYRVIANNSGLVRVNYADKAVSVLSPAAHGYGNLTNKTVKKSEMKEANGSVSYTTSSANGYGTVNATINLGKAGYGDKFYISRGSGVLNAIDNGNGSYSLTITQIPIAECQGAEIVVKVRGISSSSSKDSSSSSISITPGTVYYVDCNDKDRQSYILEIPSSNPNSSGTASTVTCDINDITKSSTGGLSFTFTVPDDDCNCKGTTTMTGECDSNGEVRDLEDENNLKSCIKQGGFASYCNTNLQKKTDDNSNKKGNVLSETKPGSSVTLTDNNYCKVYCLEKIDFNLPGTINTDNGSYFKLKKDWNKANDSGTNMSIKGTRTCYTSEIKKKEFIEKTKSLQISIRDSWNEYQKNKKKQEIVDNAGKYKKSGTKDCTYPTTEVQYVKDAKGNLVKNADGTYKTTTVNTTGTKPNPYTYYEATNVSYPYEKGTSDGDGTWNSKLGTDTVSLTWGNNPTCNADGTITEDTAKPEITLTTEYASLLNDLASEIQKYKSCTEWNNNYCFDPDISFSYDEVYNNLVSGKIDKIVSEVSNQTIHYTSVNNDYKDGDKTDGKKTVQKYIYVNDTTSRTQTSDIDLNTIYMKQEVVKKATYKDATKEIYTYHPFGTIVIDKNTVEKKENLRSLGYAFPIALQHDPDTGIYNYYLAISNIGVGGDDAGECRYTNKIIGDSCSIFNTKTEAETGKEYVCQYKTKKCPECEVECVCPDGSTNCYVENKVCKFKECEDCKVECIGTCVWNDGDTTISYKTISLDDVYQDDTQIGGNWTEEDVKAIQDKGQTIYENKPVFKIELTPSLMNKIRQYNEDNKEYSNDTLSCSNKNSSGEYYCTSSFLKDFLSKQHANYTDFDRK